MPIARGDTYFLEVPERVGRHMAVVLHDRGSFVIIVFGQTQPHAGAHTVEVTDPAAKEFGPHIRYATHFHMNNLAVVSKAKLPPQRLGHIDDADLPPFVKAANKGFVLLASLEPALKAAGHQCQCQGGCKTHEPPCPTKVDPSVGYSLAEWRLFKSKVFCIACWRA